MPVFRSETLNLADADALEEFYMSQTNTQTDFMQLSRGPANLHTTSLDLGDIKILQVHGDGHHLWTDRMRDRTWRLGFVRASDSSVRIGGTDLTPTCAGLLRPGEECDLLTKGSYQTLELTLSEDLVAEHKWDVGDGQLRQLSESTVDNLAMVCQSAVQFFAMSREPGESERRLRHRQHWREVVLDWIELALDPWKEQANDPDGVGSRRRSQEIVRRIMKELRRDEYAKSASVEELAGRIGISTRSIYLAFQKEIGLGPRRFRKLLRLNELRSALFRSQVGEKTVTEISHEHGFSELGRTAVIYRHLFGESPSETLRRR